MTDKTETTALVIAEELNEWARDYAPTDLAKALAHCGAALLKNQQTRIAELDALQAAPPAPAGVAVPEAWRELSRRLYVELFHCDQQMMQATDEEGEPMWQQGSTVRDVLRDAKTALAAAPAQAAAVPELDMDRVLSIADVHADESREDGVRLLDRGGLVAFAKDVLRVVAAAPAQAVATDERQRMTAGRASFFMERFLKEEKLFGPNEQAALHFVLDMLAAPAQAVAVPAEVELPDVEDMAHSAVQEALSFGVNHDVLHRWMRAVMDKTVQALAAAAPAVPQWIDDPHDIEQGMMLNPEWMRAQEHAAQLAGQGKEPSPPTAVTGPIEWPATCDGLEQEAWEAWARVQRFDMSEHPMHYLFLHERTDAARQGWKAGLVYAVEQMKQRVHVVDAAPAQAQEDACPVLDDEWKRRMLDGRALVRDDMGCGYHPALPTLDEGMNPKQLFEALGIQLAGSMADGEMDMDAYDAMVEATDYTVWTPEPPAGDGWVLVAIFDTEDGPAAWWMREAAPEQPARKNRKAAPAQAQGTTPLTDERIRQLDDETKFHESHNWSVRFARAVEAAHSIKEPTHGQQT